MTFITQIPAEIGLKILRKLDVKSRNSAEMACKFFYGLPKDRKYWVKELEKEAGPLANYFLAMNGEAPDQQYKKFCKLKNLGKQGAAEYMKTYPEYNGENKLEILARMKADFCTAVVSNNIWLRNELADYVKAKRISPKIIFTGDITFLLKHLENFAAYKHLCNKFGFVITYNTRLLLSAVLSGNDGVWRQLLDEMGDNEENFELVIKKFLTQNKLNDVPEAELTQVLDKILSIIDGYEGHPIQQNMVEWFESKFVNANYYLASSTHNTIKMHIMQKISGLGVFPPEVVDSQETQKPQYVAPADLEDVNKFINWISQEGVGERIYKFTAAFPIYVKAISEKYGDNKRVVDIIFNTLFEKFDMFEKAVSDSYPAKTLAKYIFQYLLQDTKFSPRVTTHLLHKFVAKYYDEVGMTDLLSSTSYSIGLKFFDCFISLLSSQNKEAILKGLFKFAQGGHYHKNVDDLAVLKYFTHKHGFKITIDVMMNLMFSNKNNALLEYMSNPNNVDFIDYKADWRKWQEFFDFIKKPDASNKKIDIVTLLCMLPEDIFKVYAKDINAFQIRCHEQLLQQHTKEGYDCHPQYEPELIYENDRRYPIENAFADNKLIEQLKMLSEKLDACLKVKNENSIKFQPTA